MRSILFILFFCSSSLLMAQDTTEFEKLFVSDQGKTLASFFGKTIDLNLPSSKATYDKKQATIIINQFFKENPPSSYMMKHNGGGNNRSNYEIGKLNTKNGDFRTYLLYNKIEDKLQIIELRIETEE